MKKILWIFSSALLLSVGFFSTGCGEDEKLNPSVSISDEPASSDFVVGDVVSFTVTATKGTDPLKAITFYQNGGKVAVEDLKIDGTTPGDAAILITDPKDEMVWNVDITLSAIGDFDFSVKIEDEGGLTDEASFSQTISVDEPVVTIEGAEIKLYNQAGPVGYGGIDLDDGSSTGTSFHVPTGDDSYLDAELRDMGIDASGQDDNWYQRIGGINGTDVRYVSGGLTSEEFGDVAGRGAIKTLYEDGDPFTATIPGFTFSVSEKVNVGDAFVVYKSETETYYLVIVEDIYSDTDFGDNDDYYLVSIKY